MTGTWDLTVSPYIYSTKSEKLNSNTCSGWEWCRNKSFSITGSNIFCSFRKRTGATYPISMRLLFPKAASRAEVNGFKVRQCSVSAFLVERMSNIHESKFFLPTEVT